MCYYKDTFFWRMKDKEGWKPKNSVLPCHIETGTECPTTAEASATKGRLSLPLTRLSYSLHLFFLCVSSLLILFAAASLSSTLCLLFTYASAHAWFLPSYNLSLYMAIIVWPFPLILALILTADCWQRDADWCRSPFHTRTCQSLVSNQLTYWPPW